MRAELDWRKEAFEGSVSSLCWSWTPYDDGWDSSLRYGCDIQHDDELREIVGMEAGLGGVPDWARQVVVGPMNSVAACGHITFPLSCRDVIRAIGTGVCPPVYHTCHTLDPKHKERLQDLAYMLDAWLAGASIEAAAAELQAREQEAYDWTSICTGLWTTLGAHTELKDLLVERLLHQLRWWVRVTAWDKDLVCAWGRDQYLGNWSAEDGLVTDNGNQHLRPLPGISQAASPRVQRWEARLAEICPQWDFFRTVIVDYSWPCAPKAFRYYEKILWCIGRERQVISLPDFPLADPESVPNFLGELAAEPNRAEASAWWQSFLAALDAWWRGLPCCGEVAEEVREQLGEPTPVKRWMVRLYVHRLRTLHEHSGILHKLVTMPNSGGDQEEA